MHAGEDAQGADSGRAHAAPHAAAIAGIVFAVLLSASLLVIRASVPANAGAALHTSPAVPRELFFGLNLLPFAGLAFLWFLGVLRDRLGRCEDRFYATVVFGSGLLFVAMLFAAAGVAGGLLSSSTHWSLGPAEVGVRAFGRAISYALLFIYAIKMAGMFMISTSRLSQRAGIIPHWLAYLGYAFAVALLLNISYFELLALLFPLWVLILSVNFLLAGDSHRYR